MMVQDRLYLVVLGIESHIPICLVRMLSSSSHKTHVFNSGRLTRNLRSEVPRLTEFEGSQTIYCPRHMQLATWLFWIVKWVYFEK